MRLLFFHFKDFRADGGAETAADAFSFVNFNFHILLKKARYLKITFIMSLWKKRLNYL